MKKRPLIGSVIDLSIRRANGEIEHIGKIHNNLGYGSLVAGLTSSNIGFFTDDSRVLVKTGTWAQSGSVVSRITGSDTIPISPNGTIFFADGSYAFPINTGTTTAINVSDSKTVAAQTAYYITNISSAPTSGSAFSKTGFTTTISYNPATGIVRNERNTPFVMDAVVTTQVIKSIVIGGGSGNNFIYLIDPTVTLNPGDAPIINSFLYELKYTDDPESFASGSISDIAQSGTIQYMPSVSSLRTDAPKIAQFIANGNQITVADKRTTDIQRQTLLSGVTVLASINTTTDSATTIAPSNYFTGTQNCQININFTSSNVKQIVLSNNTAVTGVVLYVITFDSPITLTSGQVLNLTMTTRQNRFYQP